MAGIVPAIHAFAAESKTWMPAISAGMTENRTTAAPPSRPHGAAQAHDQPPACRPSPIGLDWIQLYPKAKIGNKTMACSLDPLVTDDAAPVAVAPRLRDLGGRRLGFVDNSKLNADI